MDRRKFLATASTLAAATAAGSRAIAAAPSQKSPPMASIRDRATGPDERRRLENLVFAHANIRQCLRKHQMAGYLPGQVTYNLGEYPDVKPWEITDADEERLDELAANGVQLVQVHSEWSDEERLFGGDKYTPANEKGFRRFVNACHRRKLKIIPYVSSCYFGWKDPDFRPEWAKKVPYSNSLWWHLAHCSPASPSWRSYLLPRICRLMDEYGVDGVYNDVGYGKKMNLPQYNADDDVIAFEETPTKHGAFEDQLGVIYDEVHRRGGIVKIHAGLWYRGGAASAGPPPTDRPLFDYMWVGESLDDLDTQRNQLKALPYYLVPGPYYALLEDTIGKVDAAEIYLQALPYMQFPILMYGKPYTAMRFVVPGFEYSKDPIKGFKPLDHNRRMREYYLKNPNSPQQAYSGADAVGGLQDFPLHYRLLKLYRRMVEEGSWAFIDITDSDLFNGPLPSGVVASAFVNDGFFLVVANYGKTAVDLAWRGRYVVKHGPSGAAQENPPSLPARSLLIVEKV